MLCERPALAGKREEARAMDWKTRAPAAGPGACKGIHLLRLRARDGSFGGMEKLPVHLGKGVRALPEICPVPPAAFGEKGES